LIINTFSILVAQRSRELALLRALGASRGQVNRSVLLEAAGVGIIGSTLGLGGGYLVALALRAVFGAFGLDLGGVEFRIEPSTVLAAYAVGIIVTVVAAYLPARRAGRLMPVQALRDDVAMPESSLHVRLLGGLALVGVGSVGMVAGLAGWWGRELWSIGLGMLSVLVGVSLLAPMLGRPVIALFGLLYRPFGTTGLLATQNSFRNPRRTAATASALMVGLALMAMMSMLGSSARASTDVAIEASLTSEYVVSNAIGQPFSTDIAAQIREVDGVETVATLRYGSPQVDGEGTAWMGAVEPDDFAEVMDMTMSEGSWGALTNGTVAVSERIAGRRGIEVGDELVLGFQGGEVPVDVVAIYGSSGAVPAEWLTTQQTFDKGGLAPLDSMLFVTRDEAADPERVTGAIEAILADLPTVTLKDPQGFADEQKAQIDQFLTLINALLVLSVLIALLGVVNTLALSVIERTREVGLLRAIGMSRRQLRTMIRLEAVVISVLGALLGVGMGVSFGWALLRALRDEGLTEMVVPAQTLVLFVLASAVLGVLAAVFPARRAARLDVLEAITTE
jgi:putative ABC transport system permease protein